MNKTVQKWVLPVCLLIIICTQLFTYLTKGEINTAFLVVVVGLMPLAVKGLALNISEKSFKVFEWTMLPIAVLGLIYVLWSTI